MLDPVEFGKAMGSIVSSAIAPLQKRIDELEARQPERGEKGDPGDIGKAGENGRDGGIGPKGDKGDAGPIGEKGEPGKDAEPLDADAIVAELVAKLLASDGLKTLADMAASSAMVEYLQANPIQHGKEGPQGPRGEAGVDGKSVTLEDASLVLESAINKHMLDLERRATDTINRAVDKIPVPKDGRDGKDGADFTTFSLDYDGERTVTIKGDGGEITKRLDLPLDRGYWREGMACEKSDIVTNDGNAWLALKDTKSKPCIENKDDWRIFARKGRDGRDGAKVIPDEPVKLK